MALPVIYRKSAPLVFNVDYFDYAAGAGYKKYYLAGADDSTSDKYFLTTDSGLISDNNVFQISGNGADKDFDLTFNNPMTIAAAEATLSYTVTLSGSNGDTFSIAWTVYHVSTGAVETSLGTVTDAGSNDGDPTNYQRRTVKLTLTKKSFGVGDKLRINAIITTNNATTFMKFDPSGHLTYTDVAGGTINSQAVVNLPFEIDI